MDLSKTTAKEENGKKYLETPSVEVEYEENLIQEKEMLEMHLVSSQQRLDVIEEKLLKFNK